MRGLIKMTVSLTIISLSILFSFCNKDIRKSDLETRIIAIAKSNHIPTLSVYIKSEKGTLEFQYKDADKTIEPMTNYGLASTTKMLSSILILKNIEEHKIELNDLVSNYIDSAPFKNISWFKSITIKHLLNHTSGIPDYTKNSSWISSVMEGSPPANYAEKIALVSLQDSSFQFKKFAYSNSNYVILEKIIEAVSNKNARVVFNDFYANLNLPNISFTKPIESHQAFFAQDVNQNTDVSAWLEDYGFEGGAYASTKDLSLILNKVFIEKTVINQRSIDSMSTWVDMEYYKINYGFAEIKNYGLGLMKYEFNGQTYIGHAGSSLKYQCFAFINPTSGNEIVLQTNCSGKHFNKAFLIEIMGEIVKEI